MFGHQTAHHRSPAALRPRFLHVSRECRCRELHDNLLGSGPETLLLPTLSQHTGDFPNLHSPRSQASSFFCTITLLLTRLWDGQRTAKHTRERTVFDPAGRWRSPSRKPTERLYSYTHPHHFHFCLASSTPVCISQICLLASRFLSPARCLLFRDGRSLLCTMTSGPPQTSREYATSSEARRPTALPTRLEDPTARQYVLRCVTRDRWDETRVLILPCYIGKDCREPEYPIHGRNRKRH